MGKPTRRLLFTADWHLGEESCLEYDNRPFDDIRQMERTYIKRHNSLVRDIDVIHYLGDMGRDFKDVIRKLNGIKIFVMGNHDHIGQYALMDRGISYVCYHGKVKIGRHLITFSHCPLRGVFREETAGMTGAKPGELWHGESRHQDFSIEDHGGLHLHGHDHAPNGGKSEVKTTQQWDVGVCGNNGMPVTGSQIESWAHWATSRRQDAQKEELYTYES